MKYSIGLDIGTTSIGWAIIDEDNKRIEKDIKLPFERPRSREELLGSLEYRRIRKDIVSLYYDYDRKEENVVYVEEDSYSSASPSVSGSEPYYCTALS